MEIASQTLFLVKVCHARGVRVLARPGRLLLARLPLACVLRVLRQLTQKRGLRGGFSASAQRCVMPGDGDRENCAYAPVVCTSQLTISCLFRLHVCARLSLVQQSCLKAR